VKNIVILLGPGACGKSTLMQTLVGHDHIAEKVLNPTNSIRCVYNMNKTIAVPGTYKNGSDSIGMMADRAYLINWLLVHDTVKTIILDGVRTSKKWDVDWVCGLQPRPHLIYVYFDIDRKENIRRLLERRRRNGIKEKELPPSTYANMVAFRNRAKRVWEAAVERQVSTCIRLTTETPEQAAAAVRKELK
jgi:energy-coupling factor transporter ATP-binding protein EcfA2